MTKKADTRARPVILNGIIPRYQVVEQSKYWPDLSRFSTVDHFFSAFENIIRASGHDVNLVWKQYIPISLPFDLESWKNYDLLPYCNDWDQAKALFRKHFGAPINSEESMTKLFSMRMEDDDTLQNYTNQFMKYVKDCGFPVNNNLLARFYQFTLPAKNKQLMVNQMSVRHSAKHQWTINEIYECVLPLFLADEQHRGGRDVENHRGKRKTEAADGSRIKASKTFHTGFFCPKHGGNAANHNLADCRSRVRNFGSENKPNRATTGSSGRSFANICNFCNKPGVPGHTCQ